MPLPRELTTHTKTAKYLAMFVFIIMPFIAFFSGIDFEKWMESMQPAPIVSNKVTTKITSSCSPYINKTYDFQITCPQGFSLKDEPFAKNNIGLLFTTTFTNDPIDHYYQGIEKNYLAVYLDVYDAAKVGDIKQWIINLYSSGMGGLLSSPTPVTIAGEKGYSFVGAGDTTTAKQVMVGHGKYVYRFWSIGYQGDASENPNADALFNQFLSTFKFTDQIDTSSKNICQVDQDCTIYDTSKSLGDPCSQSCTNYDSSTAVGVNKQWLSEQLQAAGTCHIGFMCTEPVYQSRTQYTAQCIQHVCQKVVVNQ